MPLNMQIYASMSYLLHFYHWSPCPFLSHTPSLSLDSMILFDFHLNKLATHAVFLEFFYAFASFALKERVGISDFVCNGSEQYHHLPAGLKAPQTATSETYKL